MQAIEKLVKVDHIAQCAALMIAAPPWRDLGFTYEGCLEDLNLPDLDVHGVLDESGDVLAFVATLAHGAGLEPMVEYICVAPQLRGSGLGTRLLTYVHEDLFPRAVNIYMFVSDINSDAERLYRRLGYDRVGALPDYNLTGQTEYLLRKTSGPIRSRAVTQ